jgi:antitoxin component YwqK of YwqJK toxin-antitoxin module
MKNLAVLLILFLSSHSNTQILKKSYHDFKNTRVKFIYYVNSKGEYNGLATEYTYDGAKILEENWVNGTLNGPYKKYYTRGSSSKLKISGNYKNGEKNGQFITYTYVKYGQSYFNILQSMMYNEKEADIFNTGVQTKYGEEIFENGVIVKETKYHMNGKVFYSANFDNSKFTGDYVCYNDKNTTLTKGKIGLNGKMIGKWIIPREENGDCPKDKHGISNVTYTQMIKFDNQGNVDSNYFSKTYYLSGKLRDSVRVVSLKYQSAYDYSGIWYLCGPNTLLTGPYRSFYESGKIKTEGQFKIEKGASVKTGVWKNYDSNGNLLNEINEDEIRMRAYEAKKEADRIENEYKQKIEYWFDVLNKVNEQNLKLLSTYQTKSNIKPIYGEYEQIRDYWPNKTNGYIQDIYITYKKPKLYSHFREINNYLLDSKESPDVILEKLFPMPTSYFEENFANDPKKYQTIINNLEKMPTLLSKMIECGSQKTKELDKQLDSALSIEEKIKILDNFQFEPK